MFVAAHLERRLPCSLIICDIDRFKQINDTYGHQAGDEALKSFAQLLKSACRPGDLVARYGGEEFVMLCADCQQRHGGASGPKQMRKNQAASAAAGLERQVDHRQLRRHRSPDRRHARDDAPPRRPGPARSQAARPQPGRATGQRHRRSGRAGQRLPGSDAARRRTWSWRSGWSPPCR